MRVITIILTVIHTRTRARALSMPMYTLNSDNGDVVYTHTLGSPVVRVVRVIITIIIIIIHTRARAL